jgi:hypothetical protein
MCKIWINPVYLYNKTKKAMKKIKITFGTGNDAMTHNIDVNNPDELKNYLVDLKNAGWDLSQITSIVGGWTF